MPDDPAQQPQASGWYAAMATIFSDVASEAQRLLRPLRRPIVVGGRQWNPLRIDAFYYGRYDPRFYHGITWSSLSWGFLLLLWFILTQLKSCQEEYDFIPAGGGSTEAPGKTVIVKQVKKPQKKVRYIVSKFSPIHFTVPDITEWTKQWDEQLAEETKTRYAAGQFGEGTGSGPLGEGEGDGAGFGSGSWKGMVRFIRIEYAGGDWSNNMGKGADWNMLVEFRTLSGGIKVANESESRTIEQLDNFAMYYTPPIVYITGHFDLRISDREIAMLRTYLIKKHGMIFADALGPGWGKKFMALMRRVLPDVQPIYIPFDDPIHRQPFRINNLPYVAPHDPPMVARGWKWQGRWVGYYHPGDLADAWKDGHSGVSKEVARESYKLGVNVIYYAYRGYSQWLRENKVKQ